MFVYDYQVFSWKYLKSSQKSSAASYTPETFYALSHSIHGRGMKKKCERKMRLCHAKVLPLQQKSDSRPHWNLHQPQKEKKGKVLEWLKRHAWKACIRQKRIGGSNPPLSAISLQTGKRWSPMVCRLFSLYCLCSESVSFRFCLCFR